MTLHRFPFPRGEENAHCVQRTTLDGRDYIVRADYNQRESRWYLSLHDQTDDPILSGKAVVVGWDLLRLVVDERRPPGRLYALDYSGTGHDPGLDEIGPGLRVELVYADADEVAEMLAAAAEAA